MVVIADTSPLNYLIWAGETVGVLRAAARAEIIDLKDALNRLRNTNFHLSQELYDQLIAEADQ